MLPRNFFQNLTNRGLEDLAGLAVDEAEPEGSGALSKATHDACALLAVVTPLNATRTYGPSIGVMRGDNSRGKVQNVRGGQLG